MPEETEDDDKLAVLAEVAARYADTADTGRRLAPEVVTALVDAGFARHFVPVAHGGAAGGFAELASAVAVVGESCTAAAWAASLSAYAGRYAAFLPEEGQADVWGDGPDALLAGALIPSGKAEQVAGGWRLTGEWKYISGIRFAEWVLACVAVKGHVRFFAVPRRDVEVADSWFTVGMRGTGSDTLVLTDVFVPEHRSFARDAVAAGQGAASGARCHNVPLPLVGALPFVAPLVGAARGALAVWAARAGSRVDVRGRVVGAQAATQVALARSAGEVDAAELLVLRAAAVADGTLSPPVAEAAVRGPRDTALAADLLVSAVDRVFRSGGTSGQSTSDPVQRFWRDVNSAATHVALSFENSGTAYGAWALAADETAGGRR